MGLPRVSAGTSGCRHWESLTPRSGSRSAQCCMPLCARKVLAAGGFARLHLQGKAEEQHCSDSRSDPRGLPDPAACTYDLQEQRAAAARSTCSSSMRVARRGVCLRDLAWAECVRPWSLARGREGAGAGGAVRSGSGTWHPMAAPLRGSSSWGPGVSLLLGTSLQVLVPCRWMQLPVAATRIQPGVSSHSLALRQLPRGQLNAL